MSHESRPDLLMFGRTLRLPLVRDAVTAYRQQGMLYGLYLWPLQRKHPRKILT